MSTEAENAEPTEEQKREAEIDAEVKRRMAEEQMPDEERKIREIVREETSASFAELLDKLGKEAGGQSSPGESQKPGGSAGGVGRKLWDTFTGREG